MCEACPRAKDVTLVDGATCCTWCERHRAECEARWLLAMPDKPARRRFLDGDPTEPRRLSVRKMRGDAAVTALEGLALKLWERQK